MAERSGVQRYLYWSDRLVHEVLGDLGVQTGDDRRQVTLQTPSVGGLVPSAAVSYDRPTDRTRPQLARLVEKKIGQLAVESFDGPTGVKWVKGAGSMVFGEFVNFPDFDHDANIPEGSSLPPRKHKHAYMFTRVISPAGTRTAICMYGSMKNFAGCIVEAGTPREEGWVSSAAPDILQMLETRAATPRYNRAELAYVALDALVGQGLSDSRDHQHPPDLLDNGWRRSFSYGDVQDVAEWFAEVILDEGLS